MMAKKSARTKEESVADEGLGYQSSNHRIKASELTGSGNFVLEGPCSPCEVILMRYGDLESHLHECAALSAAFRQDILG